MTFNTSTTIKEQVDYVKKYGLLIQFKKLTVFQCVAINVNLKMYSFDHLRMYNIDHINTCCSRR